MRSALLGLLVGFGICAQAQHPGKSLGLEDGVLAAQSDADCRIQASPKRGTKAYKAEAAHTFTLSLNNRSVQERLRALYDLDSATYDRLYQLSVGILAAESKFGKSPKYWIKERFPWLVTSVRTYTREKRSLASVKKLVSDVELGVIHESLAVFDETYSREEMVPLLFDVSRNSRGPTQIKFLPEKLHRAFPEIKQNELAYGSNAAIATMGYLAEALPRLKRLAARYGCDLPEEKLVEHVLYLYQGNADEIVNCTATLEQNIYYQKVMKGREQFEFSRVGSCG